VSAHRIEIEFENPTEKAAEEASSVLLSGGIVLYPSDTVYGLLCAPVNREAAERLSELKGYTHRRPFILLVDGMETAKNLSGYIEPLVLEIMDEYWPGPLTIVLPGGPECPEWAKADDGSIALRQPADPLSGMLLKSTGLPLISTSANRSGEPSPLGMDQIPAVILDGVDLILDAGILTASEPSTVIRPERNGIEVLRGVWEGA
jgi:L-threonylcarbamoyladenylate synthase